MSHHCIALAVYVISLTGIAAALRGTGDAASRSAGWPVYVAIPGILICGWLVATSRELGSVPIWSGGWVTVFAGVTIAATSVAMLMPQRRFAVIAAISAIAATAPILFFRWQPAAATALLSSCFAAVSASAVRSTRSDGGPMRSADSPHDWKVATVNWWSDPRWIAAIFVGAATVHATTLTFLQIAASIGNSSDEVARLVALTTAGSLLIGFAVFREISSGEADRGAIGVVVAASLLTVVAGEPAVVPASALAAVILIGPLVASVDRDRLADDEELEATGGGLIADEVTDRMPEPRAEPERGAPR